MNDISQGKAILLCYKQSDLCLASHLHENSSHLIPHGVLKYISMHISDQKQKWISHVILYDPIPITFLRTIGAFNPHFHSYLTTPVTNHLTATGLSLGYFYVPANEVNNFGFISCVLWNTLVPSWWKKRKTMLYNIGANKDMLGWVVQPIIIMRHIWHVIGLA